MKNLLTTLFLIILLSTCTNKPENPVLLSTPKSISFPLLKTNHLEVDTLGSAFHIAMGDMVTNIRMRNGTDSVAKPLLFAGLDYGGAWTRDAAINVWNAGALLTPEVSKNTLLELLDRKENRSLFIQGQYWDKIIWTLGAWELYLATGDKEFLSTAYEAIQNTVLELETRELDPNLNLFRGAAVYGDGVAAYHERYTQTGEYQNAAWLSNVDKWVEANPNLKAKSGYGLPMMCLSTNCLYAKVYEILPQMENVLGKPVQTSWETKAEKLKTAINTHFWDSKRQTDFYYLDPWEKSEYQEGLGLAFALLFDIADSAKAAHISKNTYTAPAGLPCVHPSYSRYQTQGNQHFGRHSGTVWPHVQAFWGMAAATKLDAGHFQHELLQMTNHAWQDKQFKEIYHPITGKGYGGLQEDGFKRGLIREWKSTDRQTWGATGYMAVIMKGLFGINLQEDGLHFRPFVPIEFPHLQLAQVPYRNSVLQITLKGKGSKIKSFRCNGKTTEAFVPAHASGLQVLEIEMAEK